MIRTHVSIVTLHHMHNRTGVFDREVEIGDGS